MQTMIQSLFTSANPWLAKLFWYWQQGAVLLQSFGFTAEWNTLAAKAVGAQPTGGNPTIDGGIDFVLESLNFVAFPVVATVEQAALVTPNMLLSITEKSGATIFADSDRPVALWTGNSQAAAQSYVMPFPRYLRGNNVLQCKLSDNGGTATHAWLGFDGVRVTYVNTNRQDVFPGLVSP